MLCNSAFTLQVGTIRVVFAYHSEDPVSPTDMKQHEYRGAKAILLLNSMDKRNISDIGWSNFSLTANNVRNELNYSTIMFSTKAKYQFISSFCVLIQ